MSDPREKPAVNRRDALKTLAVGGAAVGLFVMVMPRRSRGSGAKGRHAQGKKVKRWAYAVDTTQCIGCNACMRACEAENEVPEGQFRTWVERYRISAAEDVHVDAAVPRPHIFKERPGEPDRAFFVPKLCNHCKKSVCSQVCPVGATYHTPEGVVLVDAEHCVGCGYCVQACPYGTRFISKKGHLADKCTLCYHRITKGLLPACVQACPRGARIFGDLGDPKSTISTLLRQRRYRLLRPELGTHPNCFYLGLDREVI